MTITNPQTKQQYKIPEDLGKLLSDNGIKESEYFYAHLQHIFSVDKPNGSWFVFQSGEPDAESFWLDPNKFTVSLSDISKERVAEVLNAALSDDIFARNPDFYKYGNKIKDNVIHSIATELQIDLTPTEVNK